MSTHDWRDNLSALPDIQDAESEIEILPTGHAVRVRKALKFVPFPVKSDDPAMFTDKDGAWFVVYGMEGGPHKRRAP